MPAVRRELTPILEFVSSSSPLQFSQQYIPSICDLMLDGLALSSATSKDFSLVHSYKNISVQMRNSLRLPAELEQYANNFGANTRQTQPGISPYDLLSEYLYSADSELPLIFLASSSSNTPISAHFSKLLLVWLWMLVDLDADVSAQQAILHSLPVMLGELKVPTKLKEDHVKRKLTDQVRILRSDYSMEQVNSRGEFEVNSHAFPFLLSAFMMFGYLCLVKHQEPNIKVEWAQLLYQASFVFLYSKEPFEKKLMDLKNMVLCVIHLHQSNLGFFQSAGRFDKILCELNVLLSKVTEEKRLS